MAVFFIFTEKTQLLPQTYGVYLYNVTLNIIPYTIEL